MRLQKFLSRRGVASRRHAEDMIAAGRIRVNGRTVTEAGVRVDPGSDVVEVDGAILPPEPATTRTLMLHKPRGYICTRDPRARRTVFDLLRDVPEKVEPVGRLDVDSEGLLLLTSDGDLLLRLTHPRYEHEKTYHVEVRGAPDDGQVAVLNEPMVIDGYRTRPAAVRVLRADPKGRSTLLEFVLREGRNRQIRNMCDQAGLSILRLVRVRMGGLRMGDLPAGAWRDLSDDERKRLEGGGA